MSQALVKSPGGPAELHNGASSPRTAPDQLSDSEDERLTEGSRASLELGGYDASVLQEEEERENLLTKRAPFNGIRNLLKSSRLNAGAGIGGKEARRHRRRENRASQRGLIGQGAEEGRLMFEMEEGFKDMSSRSSSSESLFLSKQEWQGYEKHSRKFAWRWFILAPLAIVVLFVLLALGAYKASSTFRHVQMLPTLSNGTHNFAATTILISLDGFRADFLNRGLTPALSSFIASGVSPRFMLPSFPSVTFPNHFTLVTGLYPENHGVVGNSFWDPDLEEEFYYTDPLRSMNPQWWNAEPLWVSAENQGVRTAIHMWPGSEAHIPPLEPTYLDRFNESEALTTKVNRVLELLDLPGDQDTADALSSNRRPQLIAAYVPNVDSDGHKYGPNSTEIRATISDVDSMLTILMEGLYNRNLTEVVNVVVVSDHGMATTSSTRLIQLDDLIDLALIDHIDGWPHRGLRLKNPVRDLDSMYQQLSKASQESEGFDVYNLQTMPERYHFSNNKRIAPLWVMPRTGWAVVEKKDFNVAEAQLAGTVYHPLGLHGYDHEHPLMRAIFVARGPAFPHAPNSRVPVFQNIEVYNIICDSLNIKPHPNNGTLRLPLKTEGLHDDEDAPKLETPHDAPQEASSSNEIRPGHMERPGQGPPTGPGATSEGKKADDASQSHNTQEVGEQKDGTGHSWWDVMHHQIEKAKEWAKNIIETLKGHDKDS